jgi:3-deoxy-D-manno-octulosonate 8-phosphate phosphatase (KDO 8-P phosphatase)
MKVLILDVDGVLTDGVKYYDREGKVVLKSFCDKDWTAIKRFRALGVEVVFITGDTYNESILKNRNLSVIVNRSNGTHKDKKNFLQEILDQYNVTAKEVAYIGDDLFDVGIMKMIKNSFCVKNSPKMVKKYAKELSTNGGDNVIMKFFELAEKKNLIPKVSYDEIMNKIYELDLKEKF